MKPRNREINIFNMSLLDILCGALGAFCFLMLALFPYYAKGSASSGQKDDTEKLKQELEQARRELEKNKTANPTADSSDQLAKENADLKKQLADAREKLEKTPPDSKSAKDGEKRLKAIANAAGSVLFINAFWETPNVDVDLWVKDEQNTWEGPKKETPDGKRLRHQFRDATQGPGFEQFHQPGAGRRYEVYYRFLSRTGNPGAVLVRSQVSWLGFDEKGSGVTNWGSQDKLTDERRFIPAFVITLDKGKMDVKPAGQR